MSAHTPGPWKWKAAGANGCALVGSNGRRIILAHGAEGKPADDDLIAAAPELLEALREAFRAFAHDDEGPVWADSTIAKARAAIAKATGEQA